MIAEGSNVWWGLLLTAAAGLCMCLGALLSLCFKKENPRPDSFVLGFSAGLMTFLALFDLMPDSISFLEEEYGHVSGSFIAMSSFLGGILLLVLIDALAPHEHSHNPSESSLLSSRQQKGKHVSLKRAGIMLALFLGIHNFPEGMALYAASLDGMDVAIPLFIGIAMHNIPEGMAVFGPIRISTHSSRKAFAYTFASAMMQPLGAVAAMTLLLPVWTPGVSAICMTFVAGMMIYISYDELIPAAESRGCHHITIAGVVSGILLMWLSLLLHIH